MAYRPLGPEGSARPRRTRSEAGFWRQMRRSTHALFLGIRLGTRPLPGPSGPTEYEVYGEQRGATKSGCNAVT